MKLSQAVVLILIIIGILAILFCTRILYNFSNEGFKVSGSNEKYVESKDDINDTSFSPVTSHIHCLIPNNLPMDKPTYSKVGGHINTGVTDSPVPSEGKYQFYKPQLMYDGIWKEQVNQIDEFAKNNWIIVPTKYRCHEGVYGTNKLFNIRNEPIDGMKVAVDNCAEIVKDQNERRVQLPLRGKCNFFPKPDMEDILGYHII